MPDEKKLLALGVCYSMVGLFAGLDNIDSYIDTSDIYLDSRFGRRKCSHFNSGPVFFRSVWVGVVGWFCLS
jgi:hypothetical protein